MEVGCVGGGDGCRECNCGGQLRLLLLLQKVVAVVEAVVVVCGSRSDCVVGCCYVLGGVGCCS